MKIAYVGDFINHGRSLQVSGTSIIILLSLLENVDSIDLFCPEANCYAEEFELPSKVRLKEFYRYDDSKSIIRLLKIKWENYDIVLFNVLPTGFGNGTIANATALFVPLLLVKYSRQKNIKIIYHNSVFTNDIITLGYNSNFDRIRSFLLGIVEKGIFKHLDTFVLLRLYKERIDKSIGENRVRVFKFRYLESVPSIYINKAMDLEYLKVEKADIPTILMHGFWGPQKNIEMSLSALKKLKEEGKKFRLVISGGVNKHFPEYERKFNDLVNSYSDIIDEYLGTVTEKDIMKIFINANLLILPYNAPGGLSGVLEQAIFYDLPTIAIDFPEFEEQAIGTSCVKLVNSDNFFSTLANYLQFVADERKINIRDKIIKAIVNVRQLL